MSHKQSETPILGSIIFREAGLDDIADLISIRMDFLRGEFPTDAQMEASLCEELAPYYHSHIGRDFFAYIAFDGDTIIASAFLSVALRPASPAVPNGLTGYISNVYTQKEYRGRGIATQLLDMLRRDAGNRSLCTLELLATEDGRPIYEKMGFCSNKKFMRISLMNTF